MAKSLRQVVECTAVQEGNIMKRTFYWGIVLILVTAWMVSPGARHSATAVQERQPAGSQFQPPEPLKREHKRLHQELEQAIQSGGRTGEAAKSVAKVMAPHFEAEERIAMPPLGLLSSLSQGQVTPEMESVLTLTDQLKRDLPQMLEEHRKIVAALEELEKAARQENKPEHAEFAQELIQHAQMEEEVLYPAAILVGEYLKLKLDSGKGSP